MKQISTNPKNYKGYDKLGRPHWIQTEIAPKAESKRPTIKHLNYSDWVGTMGKHPQFRQHMDEYLKGHGLSQEDVDSAIDEHAKAQNIDMFTGETGKVSDRSRFILDKVAEYHRKEAGNHTGPLKAYLDAIRDIHGSDPHKGYSEVAKSISAFQLITGQIKVNPQGHTLTLAPIDNGQIRRWQLFNDNIRQEQISIGYAGMQEISDQLMNSPFPELAFMGFFKLDNLKSVRFDISNKEDGKHQSIVMEKAGMETMEDARNLVRFLFTHYHPGQYSIKIGVPVQHLQPFTKREVRSWNALYTAGVQFEIWDELYTTNQIRQLRSLPVSAYDLRSEETAMTVRYFGEPYLVTLAPDEVSIILFPTDSVHRVYRSTDISGQPEIRKADTLDYNRHYSFFDTGHLYVMNSYVANEMLDVERVHADMDTQHDISEDLHARPEFSSPETEQTINDLAQHGITLELHDEISPFLAQVLPGLPGLIHNSFSPDVYEYVKEKGLILIVNRATYALSRDEIKATYTSDTWEAEDGTMKDVHLIQIYYGDPFNIIHEFTHFLDFSGFFKETGTDSELKWICNELKSYPSMKQTTEALRQHYPADMRTALYLNKDSEVLARFIEQVTAANDPENPFVEDIDAYTNLTNSGYWSPDELNQITQTEQFRELTSKLPWKIFGVVAKSLFYGLIGIFKSIFPAQKPMEGQTKPSGDHQLTFENHRWHNKEEKHEKPALLSEKEFFKTYIAQHKDIRSKTDEEKNRVRQSIINEGFDADGFNVNALPVNRGHKPGTQMNITELKYGNRKGDMVYLLPKHGVKSGGNGYKTVKGHKPHPHEVVRIEYDGQPSYEAYKNQFEKDSSQTAPDQVYETSQGKMTGRPVEIPGADHLDLAIVQQPGSMEKNLIEVATGGLIATGFSDDELIQHGRNAINQLQCLNYKRIHQKVGESRYTAGTDIKIRNQSAKYNDFLKGEEERKKQQPFLYSDAEREKIQRLIAQRPDLKDMLTKQLDTRKTGLHHQIKMNLDSFDHEGNQTLKGVESGGSVFLPHDPIRKLSDEELRKRRISKKTNQFNKQVEQIRASGNLFADEQIERLRQKHEEEMKSL